MDLFLENIGKKYNENWIFTQITQHFPFGNNFVILGQNGSGKSSFLQILSGFLTPNEGKIVYKNASQLISQEKIYKYLAISAPSLNLWENFSIKEILQFNFYFKQSLKSIEEIIDFLEFHDPSLKIEELSSGMQQRLKLALVLFADLPLLFFDEPCSHLDARWIQKYQDLLLTRQKNSTIFIASNHQKPEYEFLENYQAFLIEKQKFIHF